MVPRPPANIRQLLESRATATSEKLVLLQDTGGQQLAYSDFDDTVNRAANLLVANGVHKGDRVSLFLTNRSEYLIFYFACFKLGAWAGPINALLTPSEVAYVLDNSGSAVAVTEQALLPILQEARDTVPAVGSVILVDSPEFILDDYSPVLEPTEVHPDDEAVIIYTSGTTGKP